MEDNILKIAVIFPSRGLAFSRTAEELLNNLKGFNYKIYFSHRKPIPDAFEIPTKEALKDPNVTHLWFVEDDMVLPPNTLKTLLNKDSAVVTADYPINRDKRGAVFKDAGEKVLFCGTGCLLVRRQVFDELKAPYFRTDIRWNIKNMGDFIKLKGFKSNQDDGYGLHDVNFCMNLHRLNIPIHLIPRVLGQRKLISLGKSGSNNGAHNIEIWDKVVKNHLLKEVMSWPAEKTGNLVTVVTKSGDITTSKEHAEKLAKQGLGIIPPKAYSVIDWGLE